MNKNKNRDLNLNKNDQTASGGTGDKNRQTSGGGLGDLSSDKGQDNGQVGKSNQFEQDRQNDTIRGGSNTNTSRANR